MLAVLAYVVIVLGLSLVKIHELEHELFIAKVHELRHANCIQPTPHVQFATSMESEEWGDGKK